MNNEFDVAVIGAGPSGAVTAKVLASKGLKVVLIDSSPPNQRLIGETLVAAARPLLRKLELAHLLENSRHLTCYGNFSAWGSEELISSDFIQDPNGSGLHLDRRQFDSDLRDAADEAGAHVVRDRLGSFTYREKLWTLNLSRNTIKCRFVVDASGRAAVVAKRSGSVRQLDDDLRAVFRFARTDDADKESRTIIEASPYGWWYTARVADQCRVLVLHVGHNFSLLIREDLRKFNELLSETTHVGKFFADAVWLTQPSVREANGARLDRFHGESWLATGDAALSFDPLSSQGIFNALYSGMKAGEAVALFLNSKAEVLQEYSLRLESIRSHYVANRRAAYDAEHRWTDYEFWRTRHTEGHLESFRLPFVTTVESQTI